MCGNEAGLRVSGLGAWGFGFEAGLWGSKAGLWGSISKRGLVVRNWGLGVRFRGGAWGFGWAASLEVALLEGGQSLDRPLVLRHHMPTSVNLCQIKPCKICDK